MSWTEYLAVVLALGVVLNVVVFVLNVRAYQEARHIADHLRAELRRLGHLNHAP